MNIYHLLNEMLDYIETHLEEKIEFKQLAKITATNQYTLERLFRLLTNITLTEYIRNRRLSRASFDLIERHEKIIDIAIKYQYENATSFSRAFEKLYGIKPSQIRNKPQGIKDFPKIIFEEIDINQKPFEYDIIKLEEMTLYGKGIKTTKEKISKDAPIFFQQMENTYLKDYGDFDFGMVVYKNRFESDEFEYWVLSKKKIPGLKPYKIEKNRYLSFRIHSQKAKEIQKLSKEFYAQFIPTCKYKLKELPELEYYHDQITDFLVPIED